MNLEEEIASTMANELAKEIDAEIMRGLLIELGWHEAVLKPMTWEEGDAVDLWVHKNIKGKHWTQGLVWMFENDEDAMWFKLRWMS